MTKDDIADFAEAWNGIRVMYNKEPDEASTRIAFAALKDYDIREIKNAMVAHVKSDKYIPHPSEIIDAIQGVLPSNTMLFGMLSDPGCMMGVWLQMKIGSQPLNVHEGIARVEMLRPKIHDFWQRALVGKYTDDELRLFNAAKLDVGDDLGFNIHGPRLTYRQGARRRALSLAVDVKLVEQKAQAKRSQEENKEGQRQLKEMMAALK